MEEKKIKVRDCNVYYVISGHGPKYLFCINGGFGCSFAFETQLKEFDPDKFTVVAWDIPGFGKSRPPNRVLSDDFFEDNAVYGYEFMMALKIPRYSVFGICGGGRSAMIMAAKYPDQVESLILLNSSSFVHPHEWKWTVNIDPVSIWPEKIRNNVIRHCEDDYETVWRSLCATMARLNERRKGIIISDEILQSIKCSTLILGGAKDCVTDPSHVNYLNSKIKNSRTHVHPEGGHFLQYKFHEDINKAMQQFLLE